MLMGAAVVSYIPDFFSLFHGNDRFGSVEVPRMSYLRSRFFRFPLTFLFKYFLRFKIKKKHKVIYLAF